MIVFEKEKLRDQNYRQKFYAKLEEINSVRRKHTYIGYATNRQLLKELKEIYEANLKDYEEAFEHNYLKYQELKSLAQQSHQHIHKAHFPDLQKSYEEIDAILGEENYEKNQEATPLIDNLAQTLESYLNEYDGWEKSLKEMQQQLKDLKREVWAEDYDQFLKAYQTQQRQVRGRFLPEEPVSLGEDEVERAKEKKREHILQLRKKARKSSRLLEKIEVLESDLHSYEKDYKQVAKVVGKRANVRVVAWSIGGLAILVAIIAAAVIGPNIYAEYQEERKWLLAKDSDTYEAYSYYLKDYPYGRFAPLAQKARLQLTEGTIPGLESATEGTFTYTGKLQQGQPNGEGKAYYDNGNVYTGCWEDGVKMDKGTLVEQNGAVYEGEWKAGVRHGTGRQKWQNGDVYEGQWVEGVREGQGTLTRVDGSKYVGRWKKGKLEGRGTFTYADGSKYTGNWKGGQREGRGIYYFADGSKYDGNWRDDLREGYGAMRWKDGRTYSGSWRSNMRHGKGKINWPNGSNYDGQWASDKISGLGTFNSRLREPFTGRWETLGDGKMVVYDNSGLILRKGNFKEGLFLPENMNN